MKSRSKTKWLGPLSVILLGTLLSANSNAHLLCMQLTNAKGVEKIVPVHRGSAMRLSFLHSIYGSQVEEIFVVQRDGFHLTQLRYGEARLVDFYGHENARFDNGVWSVSPAPTPFQSLHLATSAETPISIHVDNQINALVSQSSGALRLTLASCKRGAHD